MGGGLRVAGACCAAGRGLAGDYSLQEVHNDHWVGVWRTEAVADHASRAPDLQYRVKDDPTHSKDKPVEIG